LRESEETLRRKEALFRAITESSADIVAVLDGEGRIRYQSPSWEGVLGYAAGSLLGLEVWQVVHPEDMAVVRRRLEQLHGTVAVNPVFEVRFRHEHGGWRLLEAEATRLHDERVGGLVLRGRDMTDRRRAEEQLRQTQTMEAVGRLAGGVAHEFNNLLTGIMGGVAFLLQEFSEPGEVHDDLERIQRAAERAAGLTRQLLAFSHKQVLQLRAVDVNQVMRELEPMLPGVLGDAIRIITELAAEPLPVLADPQQLEQVLLQLVVNACAAMPHGGELRMVTRQELLEPGDARCDSSFPCGPSVVLEVSDTGTGMTPDVVQRIFEPFFTTRDKGRGTGLGLSTVYGIVKQTGGRIEVDSVPEQGSTFRVYFPLTDLAPVDSSPGSRHRPHMAGGETVLLVDDDAIVRSLAGRTLRGAGYVVLEAADADEAVDRARAHGARIDLLVTDIVMPGRSGRELVEQFARERPETRVLITSGYTDDAVVRHAVLDAGRDLLEKPYSPTTLLQRVRAALSAHPA
jgi:PAS domain S-box-containing protein